MTLWGEVFVLIFAGYVQLAFQHSCTITVFSVANYRRHLRLRSFGVIRIRISDPRSVCIMVHQRNRWIHGQSGFTGSFDASWSRQILDHWSWSPQRNVALDTLGRVQFHDPNLVFCICTVKQFFKTSQPRGLGRARFLKWNAFSVALSGRKENLMNWFWALFSSNFMTS